jgi:hypothetical protein
MMKSHPLLQPGNNNAGRGRRPHQTSCPDPVAPYCYMMPFLSGETFDT